MSPSPSFPESRPNERPRRGLFSPRERAQEDVRPETQRQVRTVRNNVEQSRALRGPMNAGDVANSFPRNVKQVRCSDGQIATRAENGFFYLPGRSGQKAFYLASGESATAVGFENNPTERKKGGLLSRIFNKKEITQSSFQEAAIAGRETFNGSTTDSRLSTTAARSIESQRTMEYFYNINSLLIEAIQKDAKGNWIEGGIVGGLTRLAQAIGNRRSNVRKLIDEIAIKNPEGAARIQAELNATAARLQSSTNKLTNIGQSLLGVVGVRNARERGDMIRGTSMSTGRAVKGLIETVATSAVMSAVTGSPSVYLGSLRVPFANIQSLPTPDKDRIAQAVAGVSYADIVGQAGGDLDAYSDNYNKSTSRRDQESLAVLNQTKETNEAMGEGVGNRLRSVASLFEFRDKANAKKLRSPEVPESEKIRILESQIYEINRELSSPWRLRRKDKNRRAALEEATVLLENITGTQRLSNQYESFSYSGDYQLASRFLTSSRSFDEFEERFGGKYNPALQSSIEAFYKGDTTQLNYLTAHIAPMARAYARGGDSLRNYLNGPLNMQKGLAGVNLYTSNSRSRKYFDGNRVHVSSSGELADFVDTAEVKSTHTAESMKLADVYARNLAVWSRGGINVQSRDIIQGLRYAQESHRTTLNSTVDSSSLPTKFYTGKQWVFTAPASMIVLDPSTGRNETVQATLTLGIKPNCMNLQPISISYDRGEKWYDITNGTAGIPLRIPLSYSWKPKEKTPPEQPRNNPGSTPGGSTGNVPDQGGYPVNPNGEGGFTGNFTPSVNTPPASPGAVGVGGTMPTPSGPAINPFGPN